MELEVVIEKLKLAFKDKAIKKAVLKKEWYELNIKNGVDSTGFCYVASEIIYHLFGGKDVWKKCSIFKSKWEHGSHVYLENKETGDILDITDDQFIDMDIHIPYDLGVGGGFMTKDMSKASKILFELSGLSEYCNSINIEEKPQVVKESTSTVKKKVNNPTIERTSTIVGSHPTVDIYKVYDKLMGFGANDIGSIESITHSGIVVVYPSEVTIPKSLKKNPMVKSINQQLVGYRGLVFSNVLVGSVVDAHYVEMKNLRTDYTLIKEKMVGVIKDHIAVVIKDTDQLRKTLGDVSLEVDGFSFLAKFVFSRKKFKRLVKRKNSLNTQIWSNRRFTQQILAMKNKTERLSVDE